MNGQVHAMQMERKTLQDSLNHKDEIIAKLEKELCDIDKPRLNRSQIERSLSTFGGSDGSESSLSPTAADKTKTDKANDTSSPSNINTEIKINPNELSLAEQVEDLKECGRRSSSRLAYLNTRLSAKDDMIAKLQNRIEEVITERDSFREALQMSFVAPEAESISSHSSVTRSTSDSAISSGKAANFVGDPSTLGALHFQSQSSDSENDDSDTDDRSTKNSSSLSVNVSSPSSASQERQKSDSFSLEAKETKSSPPRSVHSQQAHRKAKSASASGSAPPSGGVSASVLGNWQNTMTGLTTDSLKGVTSSFLSSYLSAPGAGSGSDGSSGGLSNTTGLSPHHKQYITNLEKKINLLQQKNKKLSELKSLIPVVEELKEKVQIAEDASKETDKWADEEFTILSKNIDEMRQLRKEAVAKYQHSQQEVEDLKQQISRTANTYSNFEDKLQEKVRRIQIVEQELKRTKENSVDITTHQEAQDRISTLMGESKHWQQKAQSLSKEMHRSMTLQMDYNKKKDEILKLEKKIEVDVHSHPPRYFSWMRCYMFCHH